MTRSHTKNHFYLVMDFAASSGNGFVVLGCSSVNLKINKNNFLDSNLPLM